MILACALGWLVFNRQSGSGVTQTPESISTATSEITTTPTPTPILLPCNWASFITDVTIPDDTVMKGGEKFTKTWRLKNIGSCAWNSEYSIVFSNGDNLDGPTEQILGTSVGISQTVDISVDLTAPSDPGNYVGYYKLRSNDGIVFGLGKDQDKPFWVAISVDKKSTVEIKGTDDPCKTFSWSSDTGDLECPNEDSENGTVMLVENPILEGIEENEKGIAIQPNDGQDGFIMGSTDTIAIQDGDRFKAVIGCLEQSTACDVTFELNYITVDGIEGNLGAWRQVYDGSLDKLDVDLSSFAGKEIKLVLNVKSNNGTSDQNLVVWLEPRLIRYE